MRSCGSLTIATRSPATSLVLSRLRQRLLSGAAMMMGLVYGGHARRAYAQTCTGSGGTYLCSGTGSASIALSPAGSLNVTTSAPFGVAATAGGAIGLGSNGGLTFTDNAASTIGSSSSSAITASNGTAGNLTITTNGTVTGTASSAISANNSGTGTTTVTSTGTVTVVGTTTSAISVTNSGAPSGGALAVSVNNVNAGGSYFGVYTSNGFPGTGPFSSLSIQASGTVTAGSVGLYAYNKQAGTSVAVSLLPGSKVTADKFGVSVKDLGTGDISITSSGTVTAGVTGFYIANSAAGRSVAVSLLPGSSVSASKYGVAVNNLGTGDVSITNSGVVNAGVTGFTVSTSGASAAVSLLSGSSVSAGKFGVAVNNSGSGGISITNSGNVNAGSTGLYANNVAGTSVAVSLLPGSSVTAGTFGVAVNNRGSGSISITKGGSVNAGSIGLYANNVSGTSTTVALSSGSSVTAGTFGVAVNNRGSGGISITSSGTVTNTRTGSARYSGLYAANNSPSASSSTVATVTSTSIVTGTGAGVALYSSQGRSATLNNAGTIANATGLSTDVAVRTGGTMPGTITINNTGILTGTVRLAPGVANTVNNNGVWNTAGGINDFGSETPNATVLNNSGTINAGGAAVTTTFNNLTTIVSQIGSVLSLRGSAVGNQAVFGANWVSNGGSVLLNTVLGATGSKTDQLVINGNVLLGSAPSRIFVNNQGGTGAAGAQIQVVTATGTAQSGAFVLGAPAIGGAYSYQLEQSGSNWYLVAAGFSPTVSVAAAGASILGLLENSGLLESSGMDTLRARTGSRLWLFGGPSAGAPGTADAGPPVSSCGAMLLQAPAACGADARPDVGQHPVGTSGSRAPNGAAFEGGSVTGGLWATVKAGADYVVPVQSTVQNNFSLNQLRAKLGFDVLMVDDSRWGQLVVGPTAHYVRGQATIRSSSDIGTMQTSGYGFGATATWYAPSGFYADVQGQVSFYNSNYASSTLGTLANGNRGSGWSAALELGQPLPLDQVPGWKGFSLSPLGQLIYAQAFFDDFTDPYGTSVHLNNANSLILRAGLVPEWKSHWLRDGHLERATLYGIVDVTRQLLGPASVNVSGLTVINQVDPWYGEVGLGGDVSWRGGAVSLHGQITGHTGLSAFGQSTGYAATGGFTIRF